MNYKEISKENNVVTIEIVVKKEEFMKYVQKTYMKNRGKFNIPGFRKGKAPLKIIEVQYGEGVFFEDALNDLLPIEYDKAVKGLELSPVDRPDIDVIDIGKDIDLKFTAKVDVKPEFELVDYKGIEIEDFTEEVKEEDVDSELERQRDLNARMVVVSDRNVENGDFLTLDYSGSIDGEYFEGGTAKEQVLEIGSNTFIPGFEEQLIGKEISADIEVNVSFPEDYQAENLAGKEAKFEVKINEIKVKELPALDDDFAVDTSEFETLEELKNSLRENFEKNNKENRMNVLKERALNKVSDSVEIEIPKGMIDTEVDYMLKDFEQQLGQQGLNLEQYVSYTGSDLNALKESMQEDGKKRVKTNMIIEKLIETEKIEASDEDVQNEIKVIAESQKSTVEEMEKYFKADNFEYLKQNIRSRKAVEFIYDNAVVK